MMNKTLDRMMTDVDFRKEIQAIRDIENLALRAIEMDDPTVIDASMPFQRNQSVDGYTPGYVELGISDFPIQCSVVVSIDEYACTVHQVRFTDSVIQYAHLAIAFPRIAKWRTERVAYWRGLAAFYTMEHAK